MALWDKLLGTALSMAATAASKSKKNTSTSSSSKNNYSGSATGVGTYTSDQDRIKAQMNANSKAWYETTDPAERDRLHKENVSLSETLGGGVSYDGHTGTWSGSADKPRQEFSYESAPSYTSKYQDQIDELLNGILNRDKFSYDATKDPLYAQYQDQYQREGQRAMKDTLGEVAANTGGLASSWATTAASQAGDYYASKVSDKVPELYQMAYQMYLDDIDNQVRDLGLVENMDNTQYGRYRDTMSDWRSDRDFAYGQYRDDVGDDRYQNEWNYQVGRDQISDNRYNQQYGDNRGDVEYERLQRQAETLAAYGDFSGYKALGYSDDQIRQMEQTYQQQLMTSISGGGRGGSGGGQSGGKAGSGEPDYEGLYAAAKGSQNPQNYIATHYKDFGLTSSTGLSGGYDKWYENNGYGMTYPQLGTVAKELANRINSYGIDSASLSDSITRYIQQGRMTEAEGAYLLSMIGY